MDPQFLVEITGTCMYNDKIYHELTVSVYLNEHIFIYHYTFQIIIFEDQCETPIDTS